MIWHIRLFTGTTGCTKKSWPNKSWIKFQLLVASLVILHSIFPWLGVTFGEIFNDIHSLLCLLGGYLCEMRDRKKCVFKTELILRSSLEHMTCPALPYPTPYPSLPASLPVCLCFSPSDYKKRTDQTAIQLHHGALTTTVLAFKFVQSWGIKIQQVTAQQMLGGSSQGDNLGSVSRDFPKK